MLFWLCRLMLLSTHSFQFPEYLCKTTDLTPVNDKLYHIKLYLWKKKSNPIMFASLLAIVFFFFLFIRIESLSNCMLDNLLKFCSFPLLSMISWSFQINWLFNCMFVLATYFCLVFFTLCVYYFIISFIIFNYDTVCLIIIAFSISMKSLKIPKR